MKTANTALHKLKLIEVALLIGLAAFLVYGGLARIPSFLQGNTTGLPCLPVSI